MAKKKQSIDDILEKFDKQGATLSILGKIFGYSLVCLLALGIASAIKFLFNYLF